MNERLKAAIHNRSNAAIKLRERQLKHDVKMSHSTSNWSILRARPIDEYSGDFELYTECLNCGGSVIE